MRFKGFLSILIGAVHIFNAASAAAEESIIHRYEKSLLKQNQIDLSAIFTSGYSEVRWDQNGDGSIDQWFIRKGSLEIQEFFQNSNLVGFKISQRTKRNMIFLTYSMGPTHTLKLVENRAIPLQVYFNLALYDSSSSSPAILSKKTESLCRPFSSFFTSQDWNNIQAVANQSGQSEKINGMLSENCKQLSRSQKEDLMLSLKSIYGLKLDGFIEENKIAQCISQDELTKPLIPKFIETVAQAPWGDKYSVTPPLQITCVQKSPGQCGRASFNNQTYKMEIPFSQPVCQSDMKAFYRENILHETLHMLDPNLPENGIQAISKKCSAENSSQKDHPFSFDDDTQKTLKFGQSLIGLKSSSTIIDPAKTTAISNQTSDSLVAKVPPELAAGQLAPGKPLGSSSGMASLNSGFRPVSSGDSGLTLNKAFSESQARTSPVLALAEGIVRNAVIRPAQAQPIPSLAAASNTNSVSKSPRQIASVSSGQAPSWISAKPSQTEEMKNPKRDSNSELNFDSSRSPNENLGATSNQKKAQLMAGSERSETAAASKSAGSVGRPETSSPSLSSSSARSISSLDSKSSQSTGSNKLSDQSPENPLQIRRLQVEKQLLQLPTASLWPYVQKNERQLKDLKIHILDSKNKSWGETNPQKALVKMREQNHRLIREDE